MSKLYQEERDSSVTHDGRRYSLNRLFRLTQNDPVIMVQVSDLVWLTTEGPSPDPTRVEKADLDAPILITLWNHRLVVLDGWHRLHKAMKVSRADLPARYVTEVYLAQSRG